jgi:hypothetical protein
LDTLLDNEKTDHESAVTKKRGRPKQKETQDSRAFRCRYRSHVRTYYLDFTIVESLSGVEVQSVTASSQRSSTDLSTMIRLLGIRKIQATIRKHLVKEKIITPLGDLSFHESTLLG